MISIEVAKNYGKSCIILQTFPTTGFLKQSRPCSKLHDKNTDKEQLR